MSRQKNQAQLQISWHDLEQLGDEFRASAKRSDLDKLLAAWSEYSGRFEVDYETLALAWKGLCKILEFKSDEHGALYYRLNDLEKATELHAWLRENVFKTYLTGEFLFVRNTELCFLGMDEYIKNEKDADRVPSSWITMILVNRIVLALERFALKMDVSGEWQKDEWTPQADEVIVGRMRFLFDEYF